MLLCRPVVSPSLAAGTLTILVAADPAAGLGVLFVPAVSFAVGVTPQGVAIGDLDGDGDADVVSSNGSTDTVSVLLNNGGGTFAPGVRYEVGRRGVRVAIGDLDGDGD
ncbi:MAG: FG-GAP-like repeat-containing protein, partial [Phycisphaerales bacterium]